MKRDSNVLVRSRRAKKQICAGNCLGLKSHWGQTKKSLGAGERSKDWGAGELGG